MLNEKTLLELMADLESDHVERTVSTKDKNKFCEAICAFSNDFPNRQKPGYLMIGVDDQGKPSGLKVTDALLLNLAAIRSDGNVLPLPAMTVQKYTLPDGEIAVVEVLPSDLPPVRYRGQVWIRVGPRRAIANETEERILSERRGMSARTFDSRPCMGSVLSDLSLDLFLVTYLPNAVSADIIAENHRDVKEQLASLRFYDLQKDCPTYGGLLLFGKDPLQWMPGAYMQFVRFEGDSLVSDPETEQVLSGDLMTLLRELDNLVDLHLRSVPAAISRLREQTI